MLKFIVRRLLWTIPVMFGVVFIVFTIDRFAPGDPVSRELGASYTQEQYDAKKAELGLDRPFLEQFFSYIAGIFHGDLGTSYHTGIPVAESIANRWPTSLKLGFLSVVFAVVIGIPLGVISAVRHNTVIDRILTCWSLVFAAMPGFWLALMLMILFAINVKWFPASFNAELGLRSWVLLRERALPRELPDGVPPSGRPLGASAFSSG